MLDGHELTGKYFPEWVRSYVNDDTTQCKSSHMFNGSINVEVYHRNQVDMKNALVKCRKVLKFLRSEFEELKSMKVKIVLILTNRKKIVRRNTQSEKIVIGANEINSAVCFKGQHPSDDLPDIVVYRLEDMRKVLIHEIIHHLKRDLFRPGMNMKTVVKMENLIKATYPSVSSVNIMLNEAFTEAYAQYLHCKASFGKLGEQRELSLRNVKKFLRLNGCQSIEEFKIITDYREYSHPFAYILLSSALLHSDRFLSLVEGDKLLTKMNTIIEDCIDDELWKKSVSQIKDRSSVNFHFKLSV